jgi:uncharacterized membrane protein SpoIIM required for sporulation
VDVDRFVRQHGTEWARLEALSRQRVRHLEAGQLDELVRLYQRTSAHLAYAQTYLADPALTARLTNLVGRAGAVVYGTRARSWAGIGRFFTQGFPEAVWGLRWFVLISATLFVVPALVIGVWLANSPRAINASGPAALREGYVNHDFAAYYRSQPSAQFAAEVQTNNIEVAFAAFATGIAFCLPTALLLARNGVNLGQAAGLFAAAGKQPQFWGLILPHGLLEITSIVVAGAAGLRLGWTLISPGDLSRSQALAGESRRSVIVVVGLMVTFVIAGTIEGFVTGSSLPTTGRLAIGIGAEVAFIAYVVLFGYRRPSALTRR